jgi:hypothetical protein
MGIRGEIFSTKVLLQNRTYFFNVKENRMGDLYLNIVESKNRDTGGFDRQSVILFAEDLQDFLKGFDDSLRVLEKAIREQKRSGRPGDRQRDSRESQDSRESREKREDRGGSATEGKPRRVIVKKSGKRREDGDGGGTDRRSRKRDAAQDED